METSDFVYLGLNFRASVEPDYDMGPPWSEHDGHGDVRELGRAGYSGNGHYKNRGKRPGERILSSNRGADNYAYDWQGAMGKARVEGWGLGDDAMEAFTRKLGRAPTQGEITAEAVRKDFEYLRAWVNGEWSWVTIKIELLDVAGDETGLRSYLGGIEPSEGEAEVIEEYKEDRAHELASEHDLITAWKNGKPSRANRRKFITEGAHKIRVRK